MLNWLAIAPVSAELGNLSEKQLAATAGPGNRRRLPRYEQRLTSGSPRLDSAHATNSRDPHNHESQNELKHLLDKFSRTIVI